jgi:microcompartment protein CcmK/EutM
MTLARIIGTVWATRKDDGLNGRTLLLAEEIDLDGNGLDKSVVAVDAVGAGVGETVLVVQGSSARLTPETEGKAVDAVVVAIVDNLEVVASARAQAEAVA